MECPEVLRLPYRRPDRQGVPQRISFNRRRQTQYVFQQQGFLNDGAAIVFVALSGSPEADNRSEEAQRKDGGDEYVRHWRAIDLHQPRAHGDDCAIEYKRIHCAVPAELHLKPVFVDCNLIKIEKVRRGRRFSHDCVSPSADCAIERFQHVKKCRREFPITIGDHLIDFKERPKFHAVDMLMVEAKRAIVSGDKQAYEF